MVLENDIKLFRSKYKEFTKLAKKRKHDKAYVKANDILSLVKTLKGNKELDNLKKKKKDELLSQLGEVEQMLELYKSNVDAINKYSKKNDKK